MKYLVVLLLLCSKLNAQNDPKLAMFGLQQDKQRHIAMGATIAGMTYTVAYDYFKINKHRNATITTLGVVTGVALLKETYDITTHYFNNNLTKDVWKDSAGDLAATVVSGATVTLIIRIGAGK